VHQFGVEHPQKYSVENFEEVIVLLAIQITIGASFEQW
jgi:hypothetical protein